MGKVSTRLTPSFSTVVNEFQWALSLGVTILRFRSFLNCINSLTFLPSPPPSCHTLPIVFLNIQYLPSNVAIITTGSLSGFPKIRLLSVPV